MAPSPVDELGLGIFTRPRGGGAPSGYKSPTAESWECSSSSYEDSDISENSLANDSQPQIGTGSDDSDHELPSRPEQRTPHSPLNAEGASNASVDSTGALSELPPLQRHGRRQGQKHRQSSQHKPHEQSQRSSYFEVPSIWQARKQVQIMRVTARAKDCPDSRYRIQMQERSPCLVSLKPQQITCSRWHSPRSLNSPACDLSKIKRD